MRNYFLILVASASLFISSAMATTVCGCKSGEMTATIGNDGTVTLTCSDGGQLLCEVAVIN